MSQAIAIEVIPPTEGPALVLPDEQAYVTETATGLTFAADTPIDLWAGLVSRLIVGRQRISFALADAINFGRDAYGEMYAQWVDETGLQETTLMNVAWVGRQVPASRRREGVDFTYHQAVAALPPEKQESLLDRAVESGWKRYQLREAVKAEEQAIAGRAVTVDGAAVEPADDLEWRPSKADLVDECRARLEIRLSEMDRKHRVGFEAGWLQAHVEADALGCFKRDGE
jgi:hypothetical protein